MTGAVSSAPGWEKDAAAVERPVGVGRVAAAIVWKDLAAEWRSREMVAGMLIFSLLVILLFHFTLELEVQRRPSVTAGILWVALAFAGTVGLSRSLARERDRESWDGLLLAPSDRSAIFIGKAVANLLFVWLAAAALIPLTSVFYSVALLQWRVISILALGTAGYITVGTLLATIAVQARTREILLPILLFPLAVPVLIAGAKATEGVLAGLPWVEIAPWVNLIVAYDGVFLSLAWLGFEYVVEE
jgi:heme exporter protein B